MKNIHRINSLVTVSHVKTAQVKQLVATLVKSEKDELTTDEVVELLRSAKSELQTRQDPARIFAYYTRELREIGVIQTVDQPRVTKIDRHTFVEGLGI